MPGAVPHKLHVVVPFGLLRLLDLAMPFQLGVLAMCCSLLLPCRLLLELPLLLSLLLYPPILRFILSP